MGKLGYSSITLTDLTETLPVFLTLESNLLNNIQKKNGSLYTPDFKTGDGVIITPSLFIGAKKESLIKDIYYIVDGNKYHTVENEIGSGSIGINSQGQLVIKENINHSYEISAFIDNFTIGEHGYSTNVKSRNKISIFVLEESSVYTAVISSNREHFDENNTSDIVLTAQFYKGTKEVANATYNWDGLTDDDSSSTDSNINGNSNTLTLSRAQVKGTEVISCTMTDPSTKLSFVATKVIRDYVDEYRADLLPSSSLILTPNNSSVKLTARVWNKTNIINEGHTFSYEWKLIKSDGTSTTILENTSLLNIDTTSTFPKENFTIACTITIDGKTTASAYQNITYSPVEYTVNVEPKQVWLNVDSDGNYSGEHTFNFKFQLLNKEKNPIPKESNDGFISSSPWSASVITEGKWDYDLTLAVNSETINSDEDSKIFEFKYQYLGKEFSEEVYVIKNYAGKDGTSGVGYTIDLSNEFHLFEGEEVAAKGNQSVEIEIIAKYGDEDLIITAINLEDVPPGLNYSYSEENKVLTFSVDSDNKLTEIKPIKILITTQKDQDDISPKQWLKIFNYNINYEKKSYSLSFDSNVITYYDTTKTYLPAQLSVFPLVKNNMGINSAYEEGTILYSYDNDNWNLLLKDQNKGYIISNYAGERIYIKLYHANAGINNNTNLSGITETKKEFLLDEETIPILTSLDGVEIGGDNLLRWTKTMPMETNKWSSSAVNTDNIYQEQEGDFNSIVIDHSAFWSYVFSPKEKINEEYSDKTFCFSCYVYFDEEIPIVSNPILGAQLRLYSNFSDSFTARRFYKKIAALSSGVTSYPTFISKEEIVAGKWIKIYQTFTWNNFIPENPEDSITPEACKYFSIALLSGADSDTNKRKVKIKKPKLEIGNVPTEWSASPYDITYENINGINLVSDSYSYIMTLNKENSRIVTSSSLSPDFSYVLTWKNITGNKQFCWTIEDGSEILVYNNISSEQSNYLYHFTKDNFQSKQWNLVFYFGYYENGKIIHYDSSDSIKIYKIKLEQGDNPTPFNLTAEQIDLIKEQIDNDYIFLNGQFINLQEDLANFEQTSRVNIDNLQGQINTVTSQIAVNESSIIEFRNAINIDSSSTPPSITIKTESKTENNSQSFSLVLTPTELSFVNAQNEDSKTLASMSTDTLIINRSELIESRVSESFNIGGLNFKITESGIGLVWDLD